MMRVVGLCAALLIVVSPVLILPLVPVFGVAAVAGMVCAAAVLLPSLGLAVIGSIVALLVFAAALLLTPTPYALFAALLLGFGLLILLDAVHFEQRFVRAEGKVWIVSAHLSSLGSAVSLSLAAALLITVGAAMVSQELNPIVRTIIAAFGGILVIAAMMWKALRYGSH